MTAEQVQIVPPSAEDLEDTAELPALALPDGGAGAPAATHVEASLTALTGSLRELEVELGQKREQLAVYEREVGARDTQITHLQALHAAGAQALEGVGQTLKAREQALQHSAEALVASEARVGQLSAQLQGVREELALQADALELQRQRLQAREQELRERTEGLAASDAKGQQLDAQLQHERVETQRAEQAWRSAEALLASEREVLGAWRQRAERGSEQLQHLEARRGLYETQLDERERIAASYAANLASLEQLNVQLQREGATREQQLSVAFELEGARSRELTRQVAESESALQLNRGALGESQRQLGEAQQELGLLRVRQTALSTEHASVQRQCEAALADLAARDARIAALQSELGDHLEMIRALNTQLAASRERESNLQGERAAVEAAQQAVHGELQARVAAVGSLERQVAELTAHLAELEQQLAGASTREQGLRDDRVAAEESIRTLESGLRQRDAAAVKLEQHKADLAVQLGEVQRQLAARDALIARLEAQADSSAVVLGNIRGHLDHIGGDAEGPGRAADPALFRHLLVRTEGDSGIVHILGRRTTIGRKSDNDLQIDEEFISRHHALVVLHERELIIEDLDSANGVFVNGARVTRKALVNGDLVAIGRSEFRYVTKPAEERG